MPYQRKFASRRKPYGRRTNMRKKRNYKKKIPYTKKLSIPTGVPDRVITKFKYQDQIYLTSATTVQHVFRINSLYDPDSTGTGHQPRGYDQWAAMYEKYRVNACKVSVSIVNAVNASQKVFMWADANQFPGALTFQDCAELPEGRATVIVPSSAASTSNYGFKRYYSMKKLAGVSYQDDIYSAAFGANPSTQIYCSIGAEGVSSPTVGVYLNISMVFYCTLYDRRFLPAS